MCQPKGRRVTTRLLLLALMLTFTAPPAADAAKVKTTPNLHGGLMFGHTEYEISGFGRDSENRLIFIRSLLTFPLDHVNGGIGLKITSTSQFRPWSLSLDITTTFTDPGGIMADHDWITIRDGFSGKFSYTESSAEGSALLITLTGEWYLYQRHSFHLGPRAGLRFQRIRQDIIDYDGWRIDYNTPPYNSRPQSGTGKGIEYRIHYLMPMLGLAAKLHSHNDLLIEAHLSYLPVFYDDFDDHLFRRKTAESNGNGSAALAGLTARINLPSTTPQVPFVELATELFTLSASGRQTQKWYGDDGATPGFDDTGQIVTGINHDVRSTQARISLRFGTTF
jgi:outer membrane protease